MLRLAFSELGSGRYRQGSSFLEGLSCDHIAPSQSSPSTSVKNKALQIVDLVHYYLSTIVFECIVHCVDAENESKSTHAVNRRRELVTIE